MKRILTLLLLCLSAVSFAQVFNPVKWSFGAQDLGNGEFELQFKAKVDAGWHVYTTKLPADGPIPTSFTFKKNNGYSLQGGIIEKGYITENDPQFQMKLSYFENNAVFRQKVKALKPGKQKITGELEFMVCNSERCLPPEIVEFSIDIDNKAAATDTTATTNSNLKNPITWSFKSNDLGSGKFEVLAEAKIEKGWHLYAMTQSKEFEKAGPMATSFKFANISGITPEGSVTEPKPVFARDENFQLDLNYFEGTTLFKQVFVKSGEAHIVKGQVEFMVCNDEECLPNETLEFAVDLNTGMAVDADEVTVPTEAALQQLRNLKLASIDLEHPLAVCGEGAPTKESKSFWNIFILGFLGGLIALLTPCVFPMIPLTVSFFTKGSGNRKKGIMNAAIYGFFIFLIYIILSLPFHFLDSLDPEILNTISTNVWLNLFFFVVFIVFAISFFGYFEITLPSALANKADNASEVGGLIGTFFMALTLALVSFSCTGPILGSLLAGSLTSDGGAMQLTAGMGGFGLALALPFTVFALFPGMLKSLPKSGGWLNTVKVVLGFMEVALAIKFLSNADLVEHWGLVKIEIFLGVWILVGIGLTLYLFGKIRFPHDSPLKKLSITRGAFGVLTLVFVVYLISGFRYSNKNKGFESLTVLSGMAPPSGYSWVYPNHCPLNLSCFHNYEEGMAYAKKVNKPVMLDFTGWACVNCRKMEENVWPKPEVFDLLNQEYVVISLYVDDREKLPADQQFEYVNALGKKKKIRTIGDKWATFQTETFKINSQPYYVLITPDEKLLNTPVGYTPSVAEYKNFLSCGLETFKKK